MWKNNEEGITDTPGIIEKTENKIKELLNRGIIRTSTWRTLIRVVENPEKDVRICQNPIPSNKITSKDKQEIPRIRDFINKTEGSNYFTVVDLKEAFYSVESDKFKTAFKFYGLMYEWNACLWDLKIVLWSCKE